ncbi:serine/threonine protein phosphatase [Bordetella genomosp. 1]|uniref:Serine/threonine protein phosphatase n=1 Tax=Bordetella genomosp. 1 TaxID=1395607 RepID=A0A261SFS6_9BORD|nr:metallophosphoesterase [Bordetella genomosp. 1]MDQ8035105.1 metallophosphoesterase [Bordetella sp.]OZI35792.1 serine/threonine protein phosphatase [Bordetella genomosp. 1]OZI58456.1 serine/threonine protein phosphatase [Bordetella genomosp. 1]
MSEIPSSAADSPPVLLRVPPNEAGRDFAVGDIHGHYSRLRAALERIGFDPARDRLFSVGDLVDRGPENEDSEHWLREPWFFAVQGNHEDYAIRHVRTGRVDVGNWRTYGGGWFLDLPPERQRELADCYARLPVVIEVPTPQGIVGLLHADSPVRNWDNLADRLAHRAKPARATCQWSRERLRLRDCSGVAGVRAVVAGHTPVDEPLALGNVYHIDTEGWQPHGYFTLLDLHTLAAWPRAVVHGSPA